MIADWDLWPYRIAAGAPEPTAFPLYVLGRHVAEVSRAIGDTLYPVLRKTAARLAEALES